MLIKLVYLKCFKYKPVITEFEGTMDELIKVVRFLEGDDDIE